MSEPAMQILLVEDQSDAVDLLQELVRTVFPTAQVKVCGTVAHALMQLDLPWQLAQGRVLYRDLAELTLAVYVDRDGAWSDRWVALLRVDGAQITERELGRVTSWARGMR